MGLIFAFFVDIIGLPKAEMPKANCSLTTEQPKPRKVLICKK